jgi:hypothetical protein
MSVKQIMLVQLYMYRTYIVQAGTTIRQANYVGPALHKYTIQADTNVCQLNYAGPALHKYTIQADTNICQANYAGPVLHVYTVQLDLNVQQANYACPDLHVCTPYRQTRTPVRQIMLVQSYMFLHRTVRLEYPAGKLCLSSSTCMYTVQADMKACQGNYAGPALHVHYLT